MFVVIVIGVFSVLPVLGATITINSLNEPGSGVCDAAECTLREAITTAIAGDTIIFTVTGTITLAFQIPINRDLNIQGPGAEKLTINGNNAGRIFEIFSGIKVMISGLKFIKGLTNKGGALKNTSGSTLAISDCLFQDNNTTSNGGAIYNEGTLRVNNSTFLENSSANGGAISNFGGTVDIFDSTFTDNKVPGTGSGGAIDQSGMMTILSSTFSDNMTNGTGGGISNNSTAGNVLIIKDSIISNNSAAQGGGLWNARNLEISNSVIVGNTATSDSSSGILNVNSNSITTAENNWWGCNDGPSTLPCDLVVTAGGTSDFDPWLVISLNATPNPVEMGNQATITFDLAHNSDGEFVLRIAQKIFTDRPVQLTMTSNTGARFTSLPFMVGGKISSNNVDSTAWVMISLSLLFIVAFTIRKSRWPRQWAITTAMIALIMVTSGCSLLNGGLLTSTDVVVISMFTKTNITAPIPGTVTITASVDAETLTTVIHFVVELPPTSWGENEAPQLGIFLPEAFLRI